MVFSVNNCLVFLNCAILLMTVTCIVYVPTRCQEDIKQLLKDSFHQFCCVSLSQEKVLLTLFAESEEECVYIHRCRFLVSMAGRAME